MAKLNEILYLFTTQKYDKETKQITLESKQLISDSLSSVAELIYHFSRVIKDDATLVVTIFIAGFTLGRMYERREP